VPSASESYALTEATGAHSRQPDEHAPWRVTYATIASLPKAGGKPRCPRARRIASAAALGESRSPVVTGRDDEHTGARSACAVATGTPASSQLPPADRFGRCHRRQRGPSSRRRCTAEPPTPRKSHVVEVRRVRMRSKSRMGSSPPGPKKSRIGGPLRAVAQRRAPRVARERCRCRPKCGHWRSHRPFLQRCRPMLRFGRTCVRACVARRPPITASGTPASDGTPASACVGRGLGLRVAAATQQRCSLTAAARP